MKDYPVGTHFIIDDKECIVEFHPNNGCEKCHFYNDDKSCGNAKCLPSEREDKIHVVFIYLTTTK